jgi:hypothetical protein
LLALAAMMAAVPAAACPPPLPGAVEPPPPSDAEVAKRIYEGSANIVYGVVTHGSDRNGTPRIRIVHVYKGDLKPGRTVAIRPSWGFHQPFCAGMIGPPILPTGAYGVIAFSGDPEWNHVDDKWLDLMFDAGWIRRSKR